MKTNHKDAKCAKKTWNKRSVPLIIVDHLVRGGITSRATARNQRDLLVDELCFPVVIKVTYINNELTRFGHVV
jgi:hypothetical protein